MTDPRPPAGSSPEGPQSSGGGPPAPHIGSQPPDTGEHPRVSGPSGSPSPDPGSPWQRQPSGQEQATGPSPSAHEQLSHHAPPPPQPPTGEHPRVPGQPPPGVPSMSPPVAHHTPAQPLVSHHTGMQPAVPGFAPPPPLTAPGGRPRGVTGLVTVVALVGSLLLATIVGVIWFGVTGGPASQSGDWNGPIAYPRDMGEVTSHSATSSEDTVYFASITGNQDTWVTAADARSGAKRWSLDEGLVVDRDYGFSNVYPGEDAMLLAGLSLSSDSSSYLLDNDTGEVHELGKEPESGVEYRMVAGMPVRVTYEKMEVLDASGETLWDADLDSVSTGNAVAVVTADDLGDRAAPGNPVSAERILAIEFDGTVTVFDKKTGEEITSQQGAVAAGSSASLVFEDVLYTRSVDDGKNVVTAYDMKQDFAEIGSWKGEKGQTFNTMYPCTAELVCVDGYWTAESDRGGSIVIDPRQEDIVWKTPKDIPASTVSMTFAGDTMAAVFITPFGDPAKGDRTQLYDADFEPVGDLVKGVFTAIDDKTFAGVSPAETVEMKVYDAQVSVVEAADGRLSKLDTYRVYPGCRVFGESLACPTKTGYRLWSYRT